jgi:hypothetical protein
MGSEEFLSRMIEVLRIIIDRRPKERPKKKVDKWVSVPIIPCLKTKEEIRWIK